MVCSPVKFSWKEANAGGLGLVANAFAILWEIILLFCSMRIKVHWVLCCNGFIIQPGMCNSSEKTNLNLSRSSVQNVSMHHFLIAGICIAWDFLTYKPGFLYLIVTLPAFPFITTASLLSIILISFHDSSYLSEAVLYCSALMDPPTPQKNHSPFFFFGFDNAAMPIFHFEGEKSSSSIHLLVLS